MEAGFPCYYTSNVGARVGAVHRTSTPRDGFLCIPSPGSRRQSSSPSNTTHGHRGATPHGGDAIERATCPTGCLTPPPAPAPAAAAEKDQQDDDQNDPTGSAHDSSCHIDSRTGTPYYNTGVRSADPAAGCLSSARWVGDNQRMQEQSREMVLPNQRDQ